jgi:hypothetical protein
MPLPETLFSDLPPEKASVEGFLCHFGNAGTLSRCLICILLATTRAARRLQDEMREVIHAFTYSTDWVVSADFDQSGVRLG